MRAKSIIIAILLISLVAIPAMGQTALPWEVRPYLSTYTDATHTWNFTAVRHRFVCPYCGYSMTVEDPAAVASDYECPDPWNTPGHPANLPLTEPTLRQRVLGHLGVTAQDLDGDSDFPLVGRPFHPGGIVEPVWDAVTSPWEAPAVEDTASYMTLRAANLGADGLVQGDGSTTSDGVRFMVVEPGSVRPAAQPLYFDLNDNPFGPAAPQFYRANDTTGTATLGPVDYIIHINPYRVSDGDVFYIWHYERSDGTNTTGLEVEVYSTLYGKDFDTDPEDAGGVGDTGELTAAQLGDYDTEGGMQIISNSGALRVEIPKRYTGVAGEGWWAIRIQIQSNTTILPRPNEVNYDDIEPGPSVDDNYNDPTETEPVLPQPLTGASAAFPDWKASFVYVDTGLSPATVATADDDDGADYQVDLKAGNGFISPEIWPYRVPPEASGVGRVMVQWSDCDPDADAAGSLQTTLNGTDPNIYYYTGREWHYLVDPAAPTIRLVTNQRTAEATTAGRNWFQQLKRKIRDQLG